QPPRPTPETIPTRATCFGVFEPTPRPKAGWNRGLRLQKIIFAMWGRHPVCPGRLEACPTPMPLAHAAAAVFEVVYEDVAAELVERAEVGSAPVHLGQLVHELHQVRVLRDHEGADGDA